VSASPPPIAAGRAIAICIGAAALATAGSSIGACVLDRSSGGRRAPDSHAEIAVEVHGVQNQPRPPGEPIELSVTVEPRVKIDPDSVRVEMLVYDLPQPMTLGDDGVWRLRVPEPAHRCELRLTPRVTYDVDGRRRESRVELAWRDAAGGNGMVRIEPHAVDADAVTLIGVEAGEVELTGVFGGVSGTFALDVLPAGSCAPG